MTPGRSRLVSVALLALAGLVPALSSTAFAQEAARAEVWSGKVDLSGAGGGSLAFTVEFTRDDDGAVAATISIPAQGAADLPLADVVYSDDRLEFSLTQVSAVFAADRDGDHATGTLTQGLEFPLEMDRLEEGADAGPARPQHPRPPFPYESVEVSYTNPEDDTTLAGTLTIPDGAGPHPAALLITGSGTQDRDETLFGHKPFLVIADHLTRAGVAVLRVDDRGIGGSAGNLEGVTTDDFAGDVLAGVRFLAAREQIDAARIGLIGHSEGGLIAPMVAARAPGEVDWLVLLAGTGIPGSELMPMQLGAILTAAGVPEQSVERQVRVQREMIEAIVGGAGEQAIRAEVEELVDIQFEGVADPAAASRRDQSVAITLRQVTTPWYRRFLAFDPAEVLREVEAPVLALNGTLDLQVPADPNLAEIEAALRAGGNEDVTTHALPGLNHLFQTASTGLVGEYGTIEETFAPAALEIMTRWIRERTGLE